MIADNRCDVDKHIPARVGVSSTVFAQMTCYHEIQTRDDPKGFKVCYASESDDRLRK